MFGFAFRLKTDLVVVSCDCITNISLFPLLNCFRKNNASIVVQLFKGGLDADAIVPGPKAKHKQGTALQKPTIYGNRNHNSLCTRYHFQIVI